MGRIAREKRLLMEEANRVLLGEQVVKGKEYTFTDGNGNQYKGKVVTQYDKGVGVYLTVPEEIAQKVSDKRYENGAIAVELSNNNGVLTNNMTFNDVFGGGLKNDEITSQLK